MKIATMVRGFIPVPRPKDIVYVIIDLAITIAEGLSKRGHQVYFYGPKGSHLNIPVRSKNLRPLLTNLSELNQLLDSRDLLTLYTPSLWDQHLSLDMFSRAGKGEFDLLHFHHPESALPYAPLFPTVPVAYTMHDSLGGWHSEIFDLFKSDNQHCISISDSQRRGNPRLPFASTIHNGIEVEDIPFSATHDDYLLFAGRLVPEKGLREAVRVARKSGETLYIIGPTYAEHQKYFNRFVKPYLSDKIRYLGYIERGPELINYFRRAKALLVPLQWEEPFGMTMVEAMACGTPVIALNRGSVSEVVRHNRTGFIVGSEQEMIAATRQIHTINRLACRQHVVAKFSTERMIDGYEKVFERLIAGRSGPNKNTRLPLPKTLLDAKKLVVQSKPQVIV